MTASAHERARAVLAAVLALAVVALLARPLLRGEIYVGSDLGTFHLPIRAFYAKCLAEGWSFLWFPGWFSGFYLHGEGQGGFLHPLNALLYAGLPLSLAFGIETVRGPVFLLAGGWLWLRRLAIPPDACWAGAAGLAFGAFAFHHFVHPNITAAVAHVPWLLWATHVLLGAAGRPWWAPAALALLTTSQALLAHPQFLWISAVVEGLWVLVLAGAGALASGRRLLEWLAAKALGVLGAGAALLPLLDALALSHRAQVDEGFAASFAIHPLGVLQLVGPYLFAGRTVGELVMELSLYAGAVPVLAFAWLLARRRHLGRLRPFAVASLVLAVLGVLLALGELGGLYRLQVSLPILGQLRAPARYALLVQVAAAAATALAFADLAGRPGLTRGRALWLAGPVALSLVAIGVAAAFVGVVPEARLADPWQVAVGPLLLALAAVLFAWAARGGTLALSALIVLAVADLGAYGLSFVAAPPPERIETFAARQSVPEGLGGARMYRGRPELTLSGVRLASGYAALIPRRVLDLRLASPLRLDARMRNVLRVSQVGFAEARTRIPRPLPRARLVSLAQVSDDPDRDIAAIDPAAVALVDRPVDLEAGTPGRARILRDEPGDIEIAVEAPGRRLLVVSESHHPGWRALRDGEPCELVRVYGDYLGCAIEAGTRRVELRFRPDSYRDGVRLSAAALALLLAWTAIAWRLARVRPGDAAPSGG